MNYRFRIKIATSYDNYEFQDSQVSPAIKKESSFSALEEKILRIKSADVIFSTWEA